MDGQEVVAEHALLFVTDPVGFENVLPTMLLGARRDARHGRRVAW